MSANNWTRCPRCTARGRRRLEDQAVEIEKLYGTVTTREFGRACAELQTEEVEFERRPENFREDYGIRGAKSGTVHVSYSGTCQDCGLSLSFQYEHAIPDWDMP